LRLCRLGRWLPHAKDEGPDLIAAAFFKNKAETLDDDVAPLMPPSYVIQEPIDNVTGAFRILRDHPGLGKSGFFVFYNHFIEDGPHIRDTLDFITFHLLPS
jgi:hypothetical protein